MYIKLSAQELDEAHLQRLDRQTGQRGLALVCHQVLCLVALCMHWRITASARLRNNGSTNTSRVQQGQYILRVGYALQQHAGCNQAGASAIDASSLFSTHSLPSRTIMQSPSLSPPFSQSRICSSREPACTASFWRTLLMLLWRATPRGMTWPGPAAATCKVGRRELSSSLFPVAGVLLDPRPARHSNIMDHSRQLLQLQSICVQFTTTVNSSGIRAGCPPAGRIHLVC